MKSATITLSSLFLLGAAVVSRGQGVVTPLTFDDVSPALYILIPNGYGGLQWDNFFIENGADSPGFAVGAISSPNVAFNGLGDPARISSVQPFTLQSAYFTAVYVEQQQIRAQGFAAGTLVFDNVYTVNNTAPTLITFGYDDINQVRFSIVSSPTGIFAMDNLSIVPEPSSGALLVVAFAICCCALRRTKQYSQHRQLRARKLSNNQGFCGGEARTSD